MKRLFFALLILSSITVAAQESVLLRVNYEAGDTYQIKMNTDISMGAAGFVNSSMMMETNITAVENGLFKTESKLTSIVMDMEQGGMSMQYSTDMKDDELDQIGQMMKAQFEPMMKATIYTTIDKLGTTLETRVEPNVAGMEQIADGSSNLNYPEEKVSVGSTWTTEVDKDGLLMKLIYTVKSIEDGTAMLDITGDVSGTGTGKVKGFTNVDLKSGVQKNSELELTVTTQGMEVSNKINLTMTKI